VKSFRGFDRTRTSRDAAHHPALSTEIEDPV
jgi:hypothetical protein